MCPSPETSSPMARRPAVASDILGHWFGGRPALAPHVADALAELAKLTQPSLAASRDVMQALLTDLFAEPVQETPPSLGATLGHDKLASGIPLLRGEAINVEQKSLRRRWLAVCKTVARQNHGATALAQAFPSLDPAALLAKVVAGRPDAVIQKAELLQLDPALTATVLRFAAFPVLATVAAALAPLRKQTRWEHGHCPTCGGWPLLGELRGLEQLRYLRCGWCASDWECPRLRCPFCANRDHRSLGFFHVEGQEHRYRAATCEECRGYVKLVSTLTALTDPQLLVTDLATLHLDLAAAERGYLVP